MLITIKQTIDPAILNKELDDGPGVSKGIIALKASGANTVRDLLLFGRRKMAHCSGVGQKTRSHIWDWVTSKKLPFSDDGCSPTLLEVLSKTAVYEVPLTGIEKFAEDVLCKLAKHPGGPNNPLWSTGVIRVPMTEVEGSKVGVVTIRIEMQVESDEDSE